MNITFIDGKERSGKTTLAHALATMHEPATPEVTVIDEGVHVAKGAGETFSQAMLLSMVRGKPHNFQLILVGKPGHKLLDAVLAAYPKTTVFIITTGRTDPHA